jgi:hypothetical protein
MLFVMTVSCLSRVELDMNRERLEELEIEIVAYEYLCSSCLCGLPLPECLICYKLYCFLKGFALNESID